MRPDEKSPSADQSTRLVPDRSAEASTYPSSDGADSRQHRRYRRAGRRSFRMHIRPKLVWI